MARLRRWCFTINNYSEEEILAVKNLDCDYVICGAEVGENGTPHLQGYAEFDKANSLKKIQQMLGGRAHLAAAKGSGAQNKVYCSKEGKVFEKGKMKEPGKRNDIARIREMVKDGGRMRDIIEEASGYQAMRGAELMMKYISPDRKEAPEVKWYWGKSGSGKTRTAVEEAGEDTWMSSRNLKWWDGYDGHENVIIDDFRGDFCTFHELLRILDRYPFRVEVKGGSRMLMAKKIWITAPMPPQAAYSRNNEEIQQLLRRISVIREFCTEVQGLGGNTAPPTEETKE